MRRMTRSTVGAVLAGILVLALAACAGLPVSGPVKLGRSIAESDEGPAVVYNPDEPVDGMTPAQIVEGFLAAGTGPRDEWAIAELFLSPDAEWSPRESVTVYTPGPLTVTEPEEGVVTVEITPEASVDATGVYTPLDGAPEELQYTLAQIDGEWRITDAPDGVVLDRNRFAEVYRSYSLMFFDPTWSYLVPDERWFTVEYAPVNIVEQLVDGGPAPWLTESVETAFTESAGLYAPSVPVRSQVAEVSLRSGARNLTQTTLDRMQRQLESSLATAGISSVDMLVGGTVLAATAVEVDSTRVEARPLVLSAGELGFLAGTSIEPLPGLSEQFADLAATAIEVSSDRTSAAVQLSTGETIRVRSDGYWQTLDQRGGLISPTIDPDGFIYSVPEDDPTAVRVFGADGTPVDIAGAWPGATRVTAIEASRDGTRIAALVWEGALPTIVVAGIVREDGIPRSFGEPKTLGTYTGVGVDLAWLDGSTLAVLSSADGQTDVIEQIIGGPASATTAPEGAVAIAGGNEPGATRLLDDEGQLFSQRGATWTPLATDIAVLAVQQAIPG